MIMLASIRKKGRYFPGDVLKILETTRIGVRCQIVDLKALISHTKNLIMVFFSTYVISERAFYNLDWRVSLLEASLHHLHSFHSNHSLIPLKLYSCSLFIYRPFHFQDEQTHHTEFNAVVKGAWNKIILLYMRHLIMLWKLPYF